MPARPRIAALVAGPPAQQKQTSPPAAPAPAARAQAADAQSRAVQAEGSGGQTLPRTGFDVLAVAAVGLALVLGGLALRHRPHAGR